MLKGTERQKRRTALGQGLDALIPVEKPVDSGPSDRGVTYVPMDSLVPNPHQPRRVFSEETLNDLKNSISEMGVIQPLLVRRSPSGSYEIIAGERRWRAARMAGYTEVPVIVRDVSDSEALEIALIENVQRENLNPLDTAEAYETLIEKYSYTHEVLAKRIGKDRSNITNHLRLLRLPDPIKEHVRRETLSMGHARTLLSVENVPAQLKLSRRVIKNRLSVRDLERIVQNYRMKKESNPAGKKEKDPAIRELEEGLSRRLAAKVSISVKSNNSGAVRIDFHSAEELERLLEIMGYSSDFA